MLRIGVKKVSLTFWWELVKSIQMLLTCFKLMVILPGSNRRENAQFFYNFPFGFYFIALCFNCHLNFCNLYFVSKIDAVYIKFDVFIWWKRRHPVCVLVCRFLLNARKRRNVFLSDKFLLKKESQQLNIKLTINDFSAPYRRLCAKS